jgi:hypothetical protein
LLALVSALQDLWSRLTLRLHEPVAAAEEHVMSGIKIEMAVWVFGLLLFGMSALFPQALIRFLGRGRVNPSPGVLMSFRIVSGFSFFGTIYRLFTLYRTL